MTRIINNLVLLDILRPEQKEQDPPVQQPAAPCRLSAYLLNPLFHENLVPQRHQSYTLVQVLCAALSVGTVLEYT